MAKNKETSNIPKIPEAAKAVVSDLEAKRTGPRKGGSYTLLPSGELQKNPQGKAKPSVPKSARESKPLKVEGEDE